MKILVTGSSGFVGKNLVANLKTMPDCVLYEYDRENTIDDLNEYCADCDVVVHLAGVNRSENTQDFVNGNLGVVSDVIASLEKHNNNAMLIYSSSIQAERDNVYGNSKKLAEEYLINKAKETGREILIYRFTNLFGKWSRPNYNTVVATFCYNIARNLPITISDPNIKLNLCYIDDVIEELINAINGKANYVDKNYCAVGKEYCVTLGELATLIQGFVNSRKNLSVINTSNEFEKKLYSTYLSFLPEDEFDYPLNMHMDNRGSFTEILRTDSAGQFAVNVAKPGIVKGNHWHNTKNEKFLVVKGEAVIKFRKIGEEKIIEYVVNGNDLRIVDIPCGYTHSITNTGDDDMIFFIWCNECYDPSHPDTYFMEV